MYQEKDIEQGDMVNRTYKLNDDIKTFCCDSFIRRGSIITVIKYTSKNRLLVEVNSDHGCHKVKRSTLSRLGMEEVHNEWY